MTPLLERVVVASRGSRLALRQAAIVCEALEKAHPGLVTEVLTVRTRGDRDKRRPFAALGGKGLFSAEVEAAVVDGRADVAVHSAKDLTAELAAGCTLVCVPARAPAADVVLGGVGDSGERRLTSLPAGARVGTSSARRRALVAELRPDLEVAELRGNLDTRLRKLAAGEVDAAILARAGIERLGGVGPEGFAELDPEVWVPAPGQGALAVEALADREELLPLFAPLEDPRARSELECERAFIARLEGGCTVPLGCWARAAGGRIEAVGFVASPDGSTAVRERVRGPAARAAALGRELAEAVLAAGGGRVLEGAAP